MFGESRVVESTSAVTTKRRARPIRVAARALALVTLTSSLVTPALGQWFWRHPQPRGYSLLSLSFPTATTGWAVGGAPLKTTDGGRTWLIQDRDALVGALAVSFVDESNGLAVGVRNLTGFIRRTTDGGITWETTWSEFGAWGRDVTFVAGSPGVAVVAGVDLTTVSPHVLLSTDGGVTWERRPLPDGLGEGDARKVAFADASIGIVMVPSAPPGNVLRTIDGGVTWELHETGADAALLDVTFVEGGVGTVVGIDGAILRTTDGGETWEPQDSGTPLALQKVSFSDADHGIALAGAGIDQGMIVTTADGGETWTVRDSPASFLEAVAFNDTLTATAAGTGGDIYRTTDGGQTWEPVGTRLAKAPLLDVELIDANTATAVAGGGVDPPIDPGFRIIRTEDGGNTWMGQESGSPWPLYGVTFVDQDTGFAVGGNPLFGQLDAVILKTTDGGDHWLDVTPPDLPSTSLWEVSCADANVCTAVGSCETIVRTEDGGASWEVQQQPTCPSLLFKGVSFTDGETGTAVGGDKILRTTDGGETWVPQASPIGGLEDVFFLDEEIGFAVGRTEFTGGFGAIIATADGGETWTVQRGNLPDVVTAIDFADASHGAVVTGGGEIYRTSDGGASWVLDEDMPSVPDLHGVSFADGETAMAVGHSVSGFDGLVLKTVGGPTFPLSLSPSHAAVCVPGSGAEEIVVGVVVESVAGYTGTVGLSTAGEPAGVTSDVSPDSVDAAASAVWTVSLDSTVASGRHVLTLTGDDGADQQIAKFLLDVVDPAQAPTLLEPANGAADVDLQPTFTWEAVSAVDEYRIQVATDSTFDEVVLDAEVAGTTFTAPAELASDTQHFWRVQGTVGCAGAWSEVFSFVTETQPLVNVTPEALDFELPVGGSDGATIDVANVGTGDLVWSIATAQPPTVGGSERQDRGVRGLRGRFGVDEGAVPAPGAAPGSSGAPPSEAAMDLASLLGASLPGARPVHAMGGAVDCDGEPGIVIHDDGTVENGYSGNPSTVDQVIFVDRFTPSAYPASFSAVCIAFVTGGPTSLDFEIVVFDDDGPEGGPGTELGALTVSADGLPDGGGDPVWFSYDLSSLDLAIESGSAYIGARWAPQNPGVFIAVDQSEGNPVGFAGGYWWNDADGVWQKIQDGGGAFAEYRSLFVRAVENPGGCLDPTTVPWLSVTPESGSTPAGGSSPVEITVDATGLDVGEHLGSLCIATNDASRPLVVVPVRLVATEGGVALAFDPSSLDFGDVDVGTTSPPQTALLQNLGSGDATGLSLTVPGGGFEADTSACGDTLPGGGSCEVSVTFAPLEPGPAAATVAVTSDQGPSATLDLAGNGVQDPPEIDVDPDSLSSTLGEGETETQPLTIANPGGEPLEWEVTDEGETGGRILEPTRPATMPITRRPPGAVAGVTREVGPGDEGAVGSHPFLEPLGDEVMLTHSESMDILSQNTAVCANDSDGTTVENHFLRTFTLGDFGILGTFGVTEVTFGVQNLTGNAGIDVNLYTLEGALVFDNLTLIGTATVHLTPQDLTLVTVPVTGTAPAGSTLVVEIEAPDLTGIAAFLPGSNNHGETAPSYIAAEACGVPEPTPYADIDFPGTHLVMTVTGDAEPLDCTLPAWAAIDPAAGSVSPGGEMGATVTFDAASLDPGAYAATLCLASNDPVRPLTTVPLALTVTPSAVTLVFDPSSLDFGDLEIGDTSAPLPATLHNSGVEAATELTFALDDGAFAADSGNCGDSLPSGESCTVSVTFAPTEPGPASATLQATSAEGASAELGLAGNGVAAGVVTPTGLEIDPEELVSDGNGVFEPGELVIAAPWWRNDGMLPKSLTGTASEFIGPDGVPHTVEEESADYGTLEPGESGSCLDTKVCYYLLVGDPAARPVTHWEATFEETLDDPAETSKTWTVHIGNSFADVPPANPFYSAIETLLHGGITDGCTASEYCPGGANSRSQMPVFVLRALEGADYVPQACTEGATEFPDVPAASPFCPWIEDLAERGIVSGCGNGNYCPGESVTRAQMAIFLLKTLEGADYSPPPCAERFDDVPCPSLFADWIEDLAAREITGGCSETAYCPGAPVSRAQMAVFVTRTFGLTLYGP